MSRGQRVGAGARVRTGLTSLPSLSGTQELLSREEELTRAAREQRSQAEQLRRREHLLAQWELEVFERELTLLLQQVDRERPHVRRRRGTFKRSKLRARDGGERISMPLGKGSASARRPAIGCVAGGEGLAEYVFVCGRGLAEILLASGCGREGAELKFWEGLVGGAGRFPCSAAVFLAVRSRRFTFLTESLEPKKAVKPAPATSSPCRARALHCLRGSGTRWGPYRLGSWISTGTLLHPPPPDFKHRITVQASPGLDRRRNVFEVGAGDSPTFPRFRAIQCKKMSHAFPPALILLSVILRSPPPLPPRSQDPTTVHLD